MFTKEKITSVAMIFVLLINTFLSSIGVVYALDDGSEELIVDEVIDSIMEEDCENHKENQEKNEVQKKENEEDRYISVDTEVYRPNSFDALAQFDLSIETVSIEEQTYTICGYLDSDFTYGQNKAAFFKSGFNVAIRGTNLYDITDENGYFEINGVPSGTHTLVITRPYYLDETITNIVTGFEDRVEISTVAKPIKMTAGDIVVDGAINQSVFGKIKFLTFAKFFPKAPVGNFYVNLVISHI